MNVLEHWIPGDEPQARLTALADARQKGLSHPFFFAERYYAPAVEAHKLFTKGHLGVQLHFLAKVQVHPERLVHPNAWRDPKSWLREPVLNRLPLAVWMMGPVRDVRVVTSSAHGAETKIVMLRHVHPSRLSVLELSVSPHLTQGGKPAIADRFECTGLDGLARVTGIWQEVTHAPRLEVLRGPEVLVQRDLPRDFASLEDGAALRKQSKESYRLAEEYLNACRLIEAHRP
jgi:hypothetical protein